MALTAGSIAAEIISLVEQDGPAALGIVLEAVAPGVPVDALVALSAKVIQLIESLNAGTEKAQVQAALGTADASIDTAEAAAVAAGLVH